MALKIMRYTTWELWEIPPGDILLTLRIEKREEHGNTPYAVIEGEHEVVSLHAAFALAVADVTCRMVARRAQARTG